ncbi:MAG TPA: polyprenyl synthetase family protein [Micromonosporaceae bacterium]|nr:polyprenyl synthetase family protein [Micromonosporaceae bacterium]
MPSELHEAFPELASDLRLVRGEMRRAATEIDDRVRNRLDHFLNRTGRLFRPSLALVAAYLTAGPLSAATRPHVVRAATAVEFLHVATLYHDDVMDEAATRRGAQSLNSRFGNSTAILSGDYLLACCMRLGSRLGTGATEAIADTLRTMCAGQIIETADLFRAERTEDDYLNAINGKTASLLAASAFLGALVAGGSPAAVRAISEYARHLGLAFQIWDDIRDIRASSSTTGKERGKDLRNGVYTLPVIYGMRTAPDELAPLLRTLADRKADPWTERRISDLVEHSGALDQAVGAAGQHVQQAFSIVSDVECEWACADATDHFVTIARAVIPELDRIWNGATPGTAASYTAQAS